MGRIPRQLSAVETEAGSIPIDETGLTPTMRDVCIQPFADLFSEWLRKRANFETELRPYVPKIEALERLNAEIEDLQQKRAQTPEMVQQDFRARDRKFAESEREYLAAKEVYDNERLKEGNRPVKIPPWYYWILMATLGSMEFLINYEAFYRSFGEIVGLAVGSALIVAIVIATISHVHGTVLKQWRSWFGPHIELGDRYWRATLVALATLGLCCVLTFVAWSRYDMAMQLMGQSLGSSILGPARVQQDPVTDVLMTMLMNMAIWIAGIIVAYWLHDENRVYVDADRAYKKKLSRYHRQYKRVQRKVSVVQAQLEDQLRVAKNRAEVLSNDAREERDLRDKVNNHNEEVKRSITDAARDTVSKYRHLLCQIGKRNGLRIRQKNREITPDEYRDVKIVLSTEQLQSRGH